jgi:aminomethyltransferase
VDFAGFEMPLRYTGDVREHQAVRKAVGLFDISHMGEFHVAGPKALEFLNRAITNDVAALVPGQALYSPMCRPDGGIVDDLLVYRFADHYMVVVNASTTAKDFAWLDAPEAGRRHLRGPLGPDRAARDPGPKAVEVLRGQVPDAVLDLGYYRFAEARAFGADAIVSRTGYTGEDGFEIYHHPRDAARVGEGIVAAGKPVGLDLVGLGARDTLRLEVAYMLYGNDIDDTTTPLEAGLGWTVKLAKPEFVGREALVAQKERGLARKLVGLELDGRRVPRHGMAIASDDRVVGQSPAAPSAPASSGRSAWATSRPRWPRTASRSRSAPENRVSRPGSLRARSTRRARASP